VRLSTMSVERRWTKEELSDWIDDYVVGCHPKTDGNQVFDSISQHLATRIAEQRPLVVSLLRDWLSVRQGNRDESDGRPSNEFRIHLSLYLARAHEIRELRPEIDDLLGRVKSGLMLTKLDVWAVERTVSALS
jgi:hypothetical protein